MGACVAKNDKRVDTRSCQTDINITIDPFESLARPLSEENVYKKVFSVGEPIAAPRASYTSEPVCAPAPLISAQSQTKSKIQEVDSRGDQPSLSESKGILTTGNQYTEHNLPKSVKFDSTAVQRHLFCDSSPEVSRAFDTNGSNAFSHNWHADALSPLKTNEKVLSNPELCDEDVKTQRSTSSNSSNQSVQQQQFQYTFYVAEDVESYKPFEDRRISTIASRCNCRVQLFLRQIDEKPIFFKGNRVRPVTIWSPNITCLKRCLAQIDSKYPHFSARAFLKDR